MRPTGRTYYATIVGDNNPRYHSLSFCSKRSNGRIKHGITLTFMRFRFTFVQDQSLRETPIFSVSIANYRRLSFPQTPFHKCRFRLLFLFCFSLAVFFVCVFLLVVFGYFFVVGCSFFSLFLNLSFYVFILFYCCCCCYCYCCCLFCLFFFFFVNRFCFVFAIA